MIDWDGIGWPDNGIRLYGDMDANGRLMAAAPELLEALKDILHAYVRETERGARYSFDPEKLPQVMKARAAIMKAEGKRCKQ